jgi:hypothetical protein
MRVTLQVRRAEFSESRIVESATPELDDGQVLVRVDKFALTANNVTYALSGDALSYWKFFPTDEPWGIVPAWGFADVVESRCPEIPIGDRIWGFLPMSSDAVLTPARVGRRAFLEASPHRRELPSAYNAYARTGEDPAELRAIEDERCVLFPLHITSYILSDYLLDNAFFGADEVLIASVSSKTGLGLAKLLRGLGDERPRIVGLTSPRNLDFVQSLGVCDSVVVYADIPALDAGRRAAFVDMAGQGDVVGAIHHHFGPNLKASIAVGVTHWDTARFSNRDLPTTPHTFFFAPAQIAKRDREWGPGEALRRATAACVGLARDLEGAISISHEFGAEAAAAAFLRLVVGRQPAQIGVIASLSRTA